MCVAYLSEIIKMVALADITHSQRPTKAGLTANIQSCGFILMNNSWCKLIQEATTTRKQPGSPPKRTQREAFAVPSNMHRSHFTKARPASYPRYQSTVTPQKRVPQEPAFYISKVTVRVFSETRISRLLRCALRGNPLYSYQLTT